MDTVFIFAKTGAIAMACAAAYFFTVTRFSLFVQNASREKDPSSHIYWIYKNRFLIWLTDRQPIISAILLWNYHRLVADVIDRFDLHGNTKNVLQLSCAFGNISERIGKCCTAHNANLVIADIVENELSHVKRKLRRKNLSSIASFKHCDATHLPYQDRSFDHVVSFFLFHELPLEKKRKALAESMRVLKPGGKIIGAEFHRPDSLFLRISGALFFFVFERYAREMWHTFALEKEILALAENPDEWTFSKKPIFKGNYFSFEIQKSIR